MKSTTTRPEALIRFRSAFSITILFLVLPGFISGVLHAGSLSDFEKSATDQSGQTGDKNQNTGHRHNRSGDCSTSSVGGAALSDDFLQFFVVLVAHSSRLTMERMRKSGDPELTHIPLREKGAPDLPLVRADVNYQHISERTKGVDGRFLIGYGPLGAQYRQTQYREEGAATPLNFIQMHGIIRMSWSEKVEFGMGYGNLVLDGQKRNNGFSMTYPLSIFPTKQLGLNFTPTWSWINRHAITDCDGSVSWTGKYCSVHAGYRRIKVREQALSGPYVGVSLHY